MRGIAIVHYRRTNNLPEQIERVKSTVPNGTKLVICDDGSVEDVQQICRQAGVLLICGPNRGVISNKNRALWALQDCETLCILEDDLFPSSSGWYEIYEEAARQSWIHHFCRVQPPRIIQETIPEFQTYMNEKGFTPIYGETVRGDLTFITSRVIKEVGGFNPEFKGVGHGHREWSERVLKAGLVRHPNNWVDIKEASEKFIQVGDTTGGRWDMVEKELDRQLRRNKKLYEKLKKANYIYTPLVLE